MEENTPKAPEMHTGGNKNTGMAVVAYILFFVPLLTDSKNDPYVKYHVKQGLVLLLTGAALWIIEFILSAIFTTSLAGALLWWRISNVINLVIGLGILALLIIGILNATSGKEKPLPVIGQFAKMFKF